jgi:HK97 family phage major capsid protein
MRTNHRTLQLDARAADTKHRTVPCTIATETPVDRYIDGLKVREVLECSRAAVDLQRAPLPLIECHDGRTVNIGLVEDLTIQGRKVRGTLRLGASQRAAELWPDIEAGIIRGLSVGYVIHDNNPPDADDVLLVTRWEPYEVSLVPVPADPNAGTFRSLSVMSKPNEAKPTATRSERRATTRLNLDATTTREKERERAANIGQLGRRFGCEDLAEAAIRDGTTQRAFQAAILERMERRTPGTPPPAHSPETGAGDRHIGNYNPSGGDHAGGYSLLRALRALVDPTTAPEAMFEVETSRRLAREMGIKPRGMLVPMGELSQRVLGASSGGGSNLVGTTHMGTNFIDLLRARSVVMALGPTVLNGLVGDVQVPRQTATAAAQWIAADGADELTPSDPAFDGITLSPKTCGALTVLSRKFVLQSDPSGEQLVRNDLAASLATALDVAALAGTGTSNQPRGIIETAGIATDDFDAATPTWAEVVGMESDLLEANVNPTAAAYVTTPTIAGLLKTEETATGSGNFIWTPGAERGLGLVNGFPAMSSSSVPAGKMILGNWSDLVLGFWRAIEVEVNPYHDFAKGSIAVRAFMHVDVAVRHGESFAVYSQPG